MLEPANHQEWIDSFRQYEEVEEEKVIRPELHPAGKALSMGEVVRAVSEATHHEAILVTDVGQNQMMSARYFKYSKERSIVTSGGLVPWASAFRQLSVPLLDVRTARYAYSWGRRLADEPAGTGYHHGTKGSGEDDSVEQ